MQHASGSRTNLVDTGLLVLRLGAGLSLFLLFGLTKLSAAKAFLHSGQWTFVDFNRKVGLPFPVLVAWYQTVNESLGALLVASGLLTRIATASLAVGFAVAAVCSLKAREAAWLDAAFYCLMFATLLLTGPGRFSLDERMRRGTQPEATEQALTASAESQPGR